MNAHPVTLLRFIRLIVKKEKTFRSPVPDTDKSLKSKGTTGPSSRMGRV
jgi:hypothetical protein